MIEEHYIEWIEAVVDGKAYRQFLKPGDAPVPFFFREFTKSHHESGYSHEIRTEVRLLLKQIHKWKFNSIKTLSNILHDLLIIIEE